MRGFDDKAIRRQGVVDWIKMGEQSVAEGSFFWFNHYFRILVRVFILIPINLTTQLSYLSLEESRM